MPRDEKGLCQVYTGPGKGKTTAALGMCLRAAGHGMKSRIFQFMKGQIHYGELRAGELSGGLIQITQGGRDCFVSKDSPAEEDVKMACDCLDLAGEVVRAGEYDIVVLDEINVALDFGLVPLERVLELIDQKPGNMELVLTGRGAPEKIIERADLVTEMREVKHYWKKGVACRTGIEC